MEALDTSIIKCRVCHETKNIEEMSISSRTTTKIHYRSMCKTCMNRTTLESYHLRKANPHPGKDYKCPICSLSASKYYLDHDWESGSFRAYLCLKCNVGLGHFKDDVKIVAKALDYLKGFQMQKLSGDQEEH